MSRSAHEFAEPMKVSLSGDVSSFPRFVADRKYVEEQAVRLAHVRLAEEHLRLMQHNALLNLTARWGQQSMFSTQAALSSQAWLAQSELRLQSQAVLPSHPATHSQAKAVRGRKISLAKPGRQSNRSSVSTAASATPGPSSRSPSPSCRSEDSTTPGPSSRTPSPSPREPDHEPDQESCPKTTLILRNLPMRYGRDEMVKLLNAEGFGGSFDLVYHPIDFGTKLGFGYAFVNFVDSDAAERCSQHFHGFAQWEVQHKKDCEVSQSTELQGLDAHVERYRNSPVMHESVLDEFKPAMFNSVGERISFAPPTKKISKPRAPRVRRQEMRVAKRMATDEKC